MPRTYEATKPYNLKPQRLYHQGGKKENTTQSHTRTLNTHHTLFSFNATQRRKRHLATPWHSPHHTPCPAETNHKTPRHSHRQGLTNANNSKKHKQKPTQHDTPRDPKQPRTKKPPQKVNKEEHSRPAITAVTLNTRGMHATIFDLQQIINNSTKHMMIYLTETKHSRFKFIWRETLKEYKHPQTSTKV
jgi:hypothetical protein